MGCGAGLVSECAWPYGASENILWEGVNQTAKLAKGTAVVSLTPVRDCPTCDYANNNIVRAKHLCPSSYVPHDSDVMCIRCT